MVVYRFAHVLYNSTIRSQLRCKYRLLAVVTFRDTSLFDITADDEFYKQGLISAIESSIRDGGEVELIGFGRGV